MFRNVRNSGRNFWKPGRDTGHIGPPDAGTVEKYAVQKGSVNGVYEESWHVADNYCLRIILYVNKDFIEL